MSRTTVTPPPGRTPLMVRCKDCGHGWAVGFTPMPLGRMGSLLRAARCPSCGANSRKIFIDTGE